MLYTTSEKQGPVLFTPDALFGRVVKVLDSSYIDMARKFRIPHPEILHTTQNSRLWAEFAAGMIRSEGGLFDDNLRVDIMRHPPTEHHFLRVALTGLDGTRIVDGTWQSLLNQERRTSTMPHILSGTVEVVQLTARAIIGVPQELLPVWETQTVVEKMWY